MTVIFPRSAEREKAVLRADHPFHAHQPRNHGRWREADKLEILMLRNAHVR